MDVTIPIVGTSAFLGTGVIAMATSVEPATAVVMAGVVAGAITQILAYLSAQKKAQREERERDFDRSERLRVAEDLKATQVATARQLAAEHARTTAVVVGKLDATTDYNKQAIETGNKAIEIGNNVNEKLLAIGEMRIRKEDTAQLNRKADHIQEVVDDTHQMVSGLAKDVEPT